MFKAPLSQYLVPFDQTFSLADAATKPAIMDDDGNERRLKSANREMDRLQRVLMAGDRHSVLLIFQAMDAAGKDGTIRGLKDQEHRVAVAGHEHPLQSVHFSVC